jgi:transposase-like protein
MDANPQQPKTLQEVIRHFSDEQTCIDAIAAMRWYDGKPACPRCAHKEHYWLGTQKRWKCKKCGRQFSVKQGTIFEDSPLSLDKWLTALWLIVNCKNGISSHEVARDLGITQKSSWFMLHRLRLALKARSLDVKITSDSGPIEVDETFVGATPKFMHAKRRAKLGLSMKRDNKTAVMGMLDRESRQVRAKVVPNVKLETLQNEILNQIEKGATVYTDGYPSYDTLAAQEYIHATVNHVNEYVRGEVHTQGIENFWSLLKRSLRGTYVAVEPFHLDRYVTEQVLRFNNRATKDNPLNDSDRFMLAISQISGKRLTYAELTGKVGGGQTT